MNINDEVRFFIRSHAIESALDDPSIRVIGKRENPHTGATEYESTAQFHHLMAWAGPLMRPHADGSPIATDIELMACHGPMTGRDKTKRRDANEAWDYPATVQEHRQRYPASKACPRKRGTKNSKHK